MYSRAASLRDTFLRFRIMSDLVQTKYYGRLLYKYKPFSPLLFFLLFGQTSWINDLTVVAMRPPGLVWNVHTRHHTMLLMRRRLVTGQPLSETGMTH